MIHVAAVAGGKVLILGGFARVRGFDGVEAVAVRHDVPLLIIAAVVGVLLDVRTVVQTCAGDLHHLAAVLGYEDIFSVNRRRNIRAPSDVHISFAVLRDRHRVTALWPDTVEPHIAILAEKLVGCRRALAFRTPDESAHRATRRAIYGGGRPLAAIFRVAQSLALTRLHKQSARQIAVAPPDPALQPILRARDHLDQIMHLRVQAEIAAVPHVLHPVGVTVETAAETMRRADGGAAFDGIIPANRVVVVQGAAACQQRGVEVGVGLQQSHDVVEIARSAFVPAGVIGFIERLGPENVGFAEIKFRGIHRLHPARGNHIGAVLEPRIHASLGGGREHPRLVAGGVRHVFLGIQIGLGGGG